MESRLMASLLRGSGPVAACVAAGTSGETGGVAVAVPSALAGSVGPACAVSPSPWGAPSMGPSHSVELAALWTILHLWSGCGPLPQAGQTCSLSHASPLVQDAWTWKL